MKRLIVLLCTIFIAFGIVEIAYADRIGNSVENRDVVDTATNIAFIDPTLVFTTDAVINSWEIWAGGLNRAFALQVYRETTTSNSWELIGQSYYGSGRSLRGIHSNLLGYGTGRSLR